MPSQPAKYGELIPLGNQALFVEKTYQLLTDNTLRQQYIERLPEALQRFDAYKIQQELFEFFDEVLHKP